jgi:hypothetical protein
VGLIFRPTNITCKSCIKQGIVCLNSQGKIKDPEKPVCTSHLGRILTTTQYLEGMNHWHGRPRYVYAAQKGIWRKVLAGTWALWGKQEKVGEKRLLLVRLYVASPRCLIKDCDNLVGALQRVFFNDEDKYLKFLIEQEVDRINPRVEIEVRLLPA